MTRSIEEITEQIISGLANTRTRLTETGPGSVLGALSRSLAVAHLELDNILETEFKNIDFNRASGEYLDKLANTYGIYRRPPIYGRGYALFRTDDYGIVIDNTILLVDLESGLRFRPDVVDLVELNPFVEEVIPIIVIDPPGDSSNINPDTKLFITNTHLLNKNIEVVTGRNRLKDGVVCGIFTTGKQVESDESLRFRLLRTLQNLNILTLDSLRQKILYELPLTENIPLENVWVTTKAPGFVEVFVRGQQPLDSSDLSIIKQYVDTFTPLGVTTIISQSPSVAIDIELNIVSLINQDIGELDKSIKRVIKTYISSLRLGEPFIPANLIQLIKPLVTSIAIRKPQTQVTIESYEHVVLGDVITQYTERAD